MRVGCPTKQIIAQKREKQLNISRMQHDPASISSLTYNESDELSPSYQSIQASDNVTRDPYEKPDVHYQQQERSGRRDRKLHTAKFLWRTRQESIQLSKSGLTQSPCTRSSLRAPIDTGMQTPESESYPCRISCYARRSRSRSSSPQLPPTLLRRVPR